MDSIDNKIQALEIKLAHQEDSLLKLNDALIAQQLKIQSLEKKLTLLIDLIKDNRQVDDVANNIAHEIPPHY